MEKQDLVISCSFRHTDDKTQPFCNKIAIPRHTGDKTVGRSLYMNEYYTAISTNTGFAKIILPVRHSKQRLSKTVVERDNTVDWEAEQLGLSQSSLKWPARH